jgi:hypothetical protein
MAETTAFPEDRNVEPVFYRRTSGFAVAGFAIGVLFALFIVIQAAIGLRSDTPLLLHPLIPMIPVMGIVLSLVALLVIGRSEGTLAGRGLAIWGVGLSLVVGLSYGAYYGTTAMVTRQQANEFVERWLKKIAQGKIVYAFLDTEAPARRLRVNNPDDMTEINNQFNLASRGSGTPLTSAQGKLDRFRTTDYVKAISQSGEDIQIEPLGVSDWEFKTPAYKVQRLYRVTTRDGIFDILVSAQGAESEKNEFEGRGWMIVFPESKLKEAKPSELGARVQQLREDSKLFALKWMQKIQGGKLTSAYLDTLDPQTRGPLRAEVSIRFLSRLLSAPAVPQFSGPAVGSLQISAAADLDLLRRLRFVDYEKKFHRADLVHTGQLISDETARATVQDALTELLSVPGVNPRLGGFEVAADSSYQAWQTDAQHRLTSPHDCKFVALPRGFDEGNRQVFNNDAVITVESNPGALVSSTRPEWRIVSLELVKASETALPGMSHPIPPKPKKKPEQATPSSK